MRKVFICLVLAIFLSFSFVSALDYGNNLSARFKFDETTGSNVEDSSLFSNNGTAKNMENSDWVTGKIGNALYFDGVNEFVNVSNASQLNPSYLTISWWMNISYFVNNGIICGKGIAPNIQWWIYLTGTPPSIKFNIDLTAFNPVINLSQFQHEWHHYAVTYNGTGVALYFDGVLNESNAQSTGTVYMGNDDLSIGHYAGNSYFNGSIDELSIWNRSLSVSEILELYEESIERIDIDLISPSDGESISEIGINFTANYSIPSPYAYNFTNATYYVWNSTGLFNNSIVVNITGILNSTKEFIDDFVLDNYLWNVWVCHENATFSNCSFADSNFTLKVGVTKDAEFFNALTFETALETFIINITLVENAILSSAQLFYNNTYYPALFTNLGSNKYYLIRKVFAPSVAAATNIPFHWIFNYDLGGINFQNTTSQNQEVFPLTNIQVTNESCEAGFFNSMNYTFRDEENQENLSATVNYNFKYGIGNLTSKVVNGSFRNISSFKICINESIDNYKFGSGEIEYQSDGYVPRRYYMFAGQNLTNTTTENLILFDLLTSASTEFQLTFTGSDFLAVENAFVFIKRQYIAEDVFKIVELARTDSNGQTILHLVRNDVIYNIEVMKDGIVIGNFPNIIAFCEDVVVGNCKITLSAAAAGAAVFKYNDALGITYTGPTYNNITRIITFNFLTTDGSVKTVLMNATRNDIFGNSTVCEISLVSAGGVLTCEVPSYIDDSIIITKVFVNGIEILKDYIVLSEFNYGKPGYFIFFVYMLAFILMFSKSKSTMLIGIIVGFITGITLGLISGRLMGIGASGIWLIIVIILMIWKLNKERAD